MNATLLSQRHLHDITVLRSLDATILPWDLKLGDHLDGFAEAIDLCTTINATLCEDGGNFGLTEAAYVLSSAGMLWSKRVDGMVRSTQRTLDVINDFDKGKKAKPDDPAKEAEPKPRKRTGHPLAVTLPETVKGRGNFIPSREPRGARGKVFLVGDVPKMSAESYLLQPQPCSLPLLDCERVRAYVDDRGNKGLDWAEFRVNGLKMTQEGFYPLMENGLAFNEEAVRRRRTVIFDEDYAGLDGMDVGNHEEELPQMAAHMSVDQLEGKKGQLAEETLTTSTAPAAELRVPASRNVPSVPINEPEYIEPFPREFSIACSRAERDLNPLVAIPDRPAEEAPFRRRNKRVMKEQSLPEVSCEVSYFMSFWDVFATDFAPKVQLLNVLNRYKWRLRPYREEGGAPPPGKKVRGRGKKPKVESDTPKFASLSADTLPEEKQTSLAVPVVATEEDTSADANNLSDAENYVVLDELAGDEDAINYDVQTDFFANIVKDPHRRLSLLRSEKSDEENGHDLDSSFVLPVDLHEWEAKLTDFLRDHEASTAAFNLELYGSDLVAAHKAKFHGATGKMAGCFEGRESAGEICRKFLSVLDLMNKKKVHLDPTGEEDTVRAVGSEMVSRDFEEVGLTVLDDSTGQGEKGNRRRKADLVK
ncbi:hypothetical protein BV898_15594 [Hypsibius exemplaris]|uniref:Condensin-2 complex subunit H2 C-terminal domain-containing protein n=1 Tax=Hypsibius exemplaris TaxID=2072580 RepID=A0A9X6RKL3_HYPEX|nr:hypothetical protein BV898_15594 [Hypsibius exemplaris]